MHVLFLPFAPRFIPYTIAMSGTLFFAGLASLQPSLVPFLFLIIAIFAGLALLGTVDLIQTRHAVLRNYPISAHLRYLLETIRPEMRQYFFEDEKHGLPFSRDKRAVVYQRANGKTLYASNYVTNNASVFSITAEDTLDLIGNSAPKHFSSSNVPEKELRVSPDGKFLYLIGPIATEIAIFSLQSEDRVPQELPEGRSPFRLKTGQWTMGLAVN